MIPNPYGRSSHQSAPVAPVRRRPVIFDESGNQLIEYYTIAQAARKLQVSIQSVYEMIKRGTLPVEWAGRKVILKPDLDSYLSDKSAQKRRNKTWRQTGTQRPPIDTTPGGPTAGHNLMLDSSTVERIEIEGDVEISVKSEGGKHIIMSLGQAIEAAPNLSTGSSTTYLQHGDMLTDPTTGHTVPNVANSRPCRDCNGLAEPGLTRCSRCAERYATKRSGKTLRDIRAEREAKFAELAS